METIITQSVQDYLKIIYDLTRSDARASTNEIAEAMGVKPASVTGMIQKMTHGESPLVDYQKHQGVVLTQHGEKIALEVIRHHRLLETYLHETLGFNWDAVHDEACRMEHVISEEFEERIDQALGNPTFDPHGDPIPDHDLIMPPHTTTSLEKLQPGQQATIQRVRDRDADLLRYLAKHSLIPGTNVTLLEHSPFDGNLSLQIANQEQAIVLGPGVAGQIFVEIKAK
jgi:DtxR family transcriptional regulator, Mn-dependent transcriptional regulator